MRELGDDDPSRWSVMMNNSDYSYFSLLWYKNCAIGFLVPTKVGLALEIKAQEILEKTLF